MDHTDGLSFGVTPQQWGSALVASLESGTSGPNTAVGVYYDGALASSRSLALRYDHVQRWVIPTLGPLIGAEVLSDITTKKAVTPEDVTAQLRAKRQLMAMPN